MHVKEHCQRPKLTRHWRRGMLWGCSCGKMYRVITIGSIDGPQKSWLEFKPGVDSRL